MKQTRYSLYTVLGFIVITAVVAIMVAHSFLHYQLSKNRIIEATKQHSKKTLNSLNKNISNLIESYSINEYEKLVLSEMDYVDFSAIIVHDYSMGTILGKEAFVSGKIRGNDGNVIDYDQNNKEMNNRLSECFHTYYSNMMSASGVELGKISICNSDNTLNLEMLEIIKENLINTFLAIIALSLVLFYTIQRFVLKPISEIINALSRTDENGIPEGNISNQGPREIESLSTSLNNMTGTIKQSRKKLEEYHGELEHLVAERVKELNCLYGISELVEKENITIEEILQGAADIIPPSWRYPEITCAQIKLDDKIYQTDNFRETEWMQSQEIIIKGNKRGSVEIYYLEEKPEIDEGPFLAEERNLINAIAERLGHIIDKKHAEEELLTMKTLLEQTSESIAIKDKNYKYILANPVCKRELSQVSGQKQIIGKNDYQLLPKEIADKLRKIDERIFSNNKVVVAEESVGEKTYLSRKFPIRDTENNTIAMGLIATDITERKQAEEEKENLISHLQQAQKMEAIGTLAGGIAHDFNNILGAIIGYTEMARDDSPNESSVAKDLDKVLEASARAAGLVKQILSFSRQNETEHILLQPASIVAKAIALLRPTLPSTIEITEDITTKTGLIFADPTQIHQVVINLCTNAFHAMEETGGKLDISLKGTDLNREDITLEPHVDTGTFIQLSIGDSGGGMTLQVKDKIFDPYFTTKGVGKGTGMGLSIVHGIVKSYGGFITLSSELGKGTIFHVFLPVVNKEELPDKEEIQQIPIGKEKILFIDDEALLAEMGKDMLERLGYHVTVRKSSLEALETFQNQPDQFDVVITDQTMPGLTGVDLARRMLQIRPDIPIILCTGYSSITSEEKAKSMGIREFALKPLGKSDIAALIRKVLEENHASSPKNLTT